MTSFKRFIRLSFALPLSLLSGFAFAVQPSIGIMGPINYINQNSINVMDTELKLSPTVKIFNAKGKKIKLEELRPGVMVQIKTLSLGSRRLADSIRVMK